MNRRRRALGSRAPKAAQRLPDVYETSAGGVVIRRIEGRLHVALLKTRHTRGEVWVLPKGHVEHGQGETRDAAAAREVREELGIAKIRLLRKLGTVRWQFMGTRQPDSAKAAPGSQGTGNGGQGARSRVRPAGEPVRIIKTVHHYLFEGLTDRLKPQASEGFLEARWIPYAKAMRLIAYPTDREVLAKVRRKPAQKTA